MKVKNLNIALHLEGPDDESGHIRLDDFLAQVNALKATLSAVDRDVNGKATVYFQLVDLSHSSPAKIVIKPKVRPGLSGKRGSSTYRYSPTRIHHAFFDTLVKIKTNRLSRITASVQVIDGVTEIVQGLAQNFKGGWIENSQTAIRLDTQFQEHLNELIQPQFQSFGSVSGELLSLSLARGSRFYVYPSAGPSSVACSFASDQLEKARENIGKSVRVYGTKLYRAGTGLPYKISNVKKIEPLSVPKNRRPFTPTPNVLIDVPADELVRRIRDEWE